MTDPGPSSGFGKCWKIHLPMAVGTSHDRDLAGAYVEVMDGNDVIQTSGSLVMRENMKYLSENLSRKYTPCMNSGSLYIYIYDIYRETMGRQVQIKQLQDAYINHSGFSIFLYHSQLLQVFPNKKTSCRRGFGFCIPPKKDTIHVNKCCEIL